MKREFLFLTAVFILICQPASSQPAMLWNWESEISEESCAEWIEETPDGESVTAGYYESLNLQDDILVVKHDADGNVVWSTTVCQEGNDQAYCLTIAEDSSIYVAGETNFNTAGCSDAYLIKISSEGDTVWTRKFGTENFEEAGYVAQLDNGDIMIAGHSVTYSPQINSNVYIVQVDQDGNLLRELSIDFGGMDRAEYFHQLSENKFVIAGRTTSSHTSSDYLLAEVDDHGQIIWSNTYGGTNNDQCFSCARTADSGYILCGRSDSFGSGEFDILIVKTDSIGSVEWENIYGGGEDEGGRCIIQTEDLSYVVTGHTETYATSIWFDLYFLKLDEFGNIIMETIFYKYNTNAGYCIRESTDGSYLISGHTGFISVFEKFWVLKIGDVISVEQIAQSKSRIFKIHNPHPNPFNATVTLDFTLPSASDVTISVFDITGKEVATLIEGPHSSGAGTVTWSAEGASSGVYFARLEAGGSAQIRKLLLVK